MEVETYQTLPTFILVFEIRLLALELQDEGAKKECGSQ